MIPAVSDLVEHLVKKDDQNTCHGHEIQHKAVSFKQPLSVDDPVSENGPDETADGSHYNRDRGPAEKIQDILAESSMSFASVHTFSPLLSNKLPDIQAYLARICLDIWQ